jgi:Sec-independent protein translocase protein TatA
MVLSSHRVLILVICIGLLVFQPSEVSGLRNIGVALRQNQEHHRILKAVAMEEMNTGNKNSTNANKNFDPNQSSKRRVRRGSDPIHNRA